MNTQPEALLYNFNNPERLRQIRRYLNRQKVKTRIVTAPEFLHPLGYLFEIPGFHPSSQFNLGSNFSDEMIVLKDFSSAQMDGFLAFFRENQIPPIALKAMQNLPNLPAAFPADLFYLIFPTEKGDRSAQSPFLNMF